MSQTVIVFQDDSILATIGREGQKPQIQHIYRQELEGYGDPFTRWKSGLAKLAQRADLQKARLVLPASMCSVKAVKLPYAKGKELDAMVTRELQEGIRGSVVDYAVIDSDTKRGVSIVAAGVEQDVLKQFLDMCTELSIQVSGVTAAMEGIRRVLNEYKESAGRTAIFLFFEEEGLTSLLMEKGEYKYSGRNRIFAEVGTLDFGTEIVRNVSGILQFQTASKSEETVTDIYYAGCQKEDFEVSTEELEVLNLTVHPFGELPGIHLPGGKKLSDWILCVGAMMCGMRGRRSMNLLTSYEADEADDKPAKATWKAFLPVIVVAVVCVAIFAGIQVKNVSLGIKILKTDGWIADTLVSEPYRQATEAEKNAEMVEQTIRQIAQLQENLATYPKIDEQALAKMEAASVGFDLTIRGYDGNSGVLTFDAGSRDVIDIPGYIMALEKTGLFYEVEYTGYSYEDGIYTLSLLCTMDSPQTGGEAE